MSASSAPQTHPAHARVAKTMQEEHSGSVLALRRDAQHLERWGRHDGFRRLIRSRDAQQTQSTMERRSGGEENGGDRDERADEQRPPASRRCQCFGKR